MRVTININTKLSPEELKLQRGKRKGIGAFFTPLNFACDMVKRYDIHKKWEMGARILDPTAGNGTLLESVILTAIEEGLEITPQMLSALKGYERETDFIEDFSKRILKRYKIQTPPQMIEQADFLQIEGDQSYDVIFGNPPWVNFTDLPDEEKEAIKPYFLKHKLAKSASDLLLGCSRIDLAALIITKVMEDHMKTDGEAIFFTPLSLLLNEGAHNYFRESKLYSGNFKLEEILDFNGEDIFPEVSTRCGLISIKAGARTKFPLAYFTLQTNKKWLEGQCQPLPGPGAALHTQMNQAELLTIPHIPIKRSSQPRQGINTGGRNQLFIFDKAEAISPDTYLMTNKSRSCELPQSLVFPLLTAKQFKGSDEPEPSRYVFLPYHNNGQCLSFDDLKKYPLALKYLEENRSELENRKGVMIKGLIGRGQYWGLMGVGAYTFSPWKVVWESFGKKTFKPRLFSGEWIPNQSLQAYSSFDDKKEAQAFLEALSEPLIEEILQSQRMEGTCNWAQPGRIKAFLDLQD